VDQVAAADGGLAVFLVSGRLEDLVQGEAETGGSLVEPRIPIVGNELRGKARDQGIGPIARVLLVSLVPRDPGELQQEEDDPGGARIEVRRALEPLRPLRTFEPDQPPRRLDPRGVNPLGGFDGGVQIVGRGGGWSWSGRRLRGLLSGRGAEAQGGSGAGREAQAKEVATGEVVGAHSSYNDTALAFPSDAGTPSGSELKRLRENWQQRYTLLAGPTTYRVY
jgi:hypothetical protein